MKKARLPLGTLTTVKNHKKQDRKQCGEKKSVIHVAKTGIHLALGIGQHRGSASLNGILYKTVYGKTNIP